MDCWMLLGACCRTDWRCTGGHSFCRGGGFGFLCRFTWMRIWEKIGFAYNLISTFVSNGTRGTVTRTTITNLRVKLSHHTKKAQTFRLRPMFVRRWFTFTYRTFGAASFLPRYCRNRFRLENINIKQTKQTKKKQESDYFEGWTG